MIGGRATRHSVKIHGVDETKQKKSTFREYCEALLIAVISSLQRIALPGVQDSDGIVEDNLKVGDHIIVNKFIYGPRQTRSRDSFRCATFAAATSCFPLSAAARTDFVKRVIGMPNDTLGFATENLDQRQAAR